MRCTLLTRWSTLVVKSECVVRMTKRLKKRPVCSVVVLIAARNNFVVLLKSFIANVLICKACLNAI